MNFSTADVPVHDSQYTKDHTADTEPLNADMHLRTAQMKTRVPELHPLLKSEYLLVFCHLYH